MTTYDFTVPPPGYRLPADIRLGPVVLQSGDLGRSLAYYDRVLGLRTLERRTGEATLAAQHDPTPLVRIALSTRDARRASKGLRRSSVFATGSSMAAAGTSLRVGCRAAESWMFGAPTSRANCNHSSIARSGSASRRSRGVSSCSAAVSTLSFIGRGEKARTVMAGAHSINEDARIIPFDAVGRRRFRWNSRGAGLESISRALRG
jgi:hypothetical protein